jgi:hypothetical protein
MAFFFLSLAILPVSFTATSFKVEFNPSFQSVVNAWGQIATAFRSGDQSITAARLSALNLNSAPAPAGATDDAAFQVASLNEGRSGLPEAETCEANAAPDCSKGESGCPKIKRQPARSAKRVELAMARGDELTGEVNSELAAEFSSQRMEVVRALHSITPVTDKLQEHIERYMLGFGPETDRSLKHLKDLRVRKIKVGKAVVQVQSGLSDCDFRKLMRTRPEAAPVARPEAVRGVEAPVSTAEGAQA